MPNFEDILKFWIEDTGPAGWYRSDAALDADIRTRFEPVWRQALAGDCMGWSAQPRSMLALLILLDQFPRNMFRGSPEAFATDDKARAQAKKAIGLGWDTRFSGPEQQFFYLPLMHAECLEDQERAVRLFAERMPESKDNLVHARAHREVIRRFGRFPHRNTDLNRATTAAETAFLADGGYRSVVDSVREPA